MLGLLASERARLAQEAAEFRARVDELEQSFKALDEQFNKWKEGVLKFEHSKLGSDDSSCGDDRIRDRESIRTGEDESDIQQSANQINGESEDGGRVYEERGSQDK